MYFGSVHDRAKPMIQYLQSAAHKAMQPYCNPANWMLTILGACPGCGQLGLLPNWITILVLQTQRRGNALMARVFRQCMPTVNCARTWAIVLLSISDPGVTVPLLRCRKVDSEMESLLAHNSDPLPPPAHELGSDACNESDAKPARTTKLQKFKHVFHSTHALVCCWGSRYLVLERCAAVVSGTARDYWRNTGYNMSVRRSCA